MSKTNLIQNIFEKIKNPFLQSLILTIIIFIIGFFLGLAYEGNQLNKINDYYINSEIFLMDTIALNQIINTETNSTQEICKTIFNASIEFANKIYFESSLLEKYEESDKLTDSLKTLYKKYDILKTILWTNTLEISKKCEGNTSFVIYLYERETEDLNKKASNKVFSRILFDLKQDLGNQIILIPIGVDNDLSSLHFLTSKFNISEYPVLVINNEKVISKINSPAELKSYLK